MIVIRASIMLLSCNQKNNKLFDLKKTNLFIFVPAFSSCRGKKNKRLSCPAGGDTNEEAGNQTEALWGTGDYHGQGKGICELGFVVSTVIFLINNSHLSQLLKE